MRTIVDQSNYVAGIGDELDKTEDPPVQRDGYRTIEDQVREFAIAGENLEEYRRLMYQYDGPGAEDVEEVSLFDDPDAGPADIVMARMNAMKRKGEAEKKKADLTKEKKADLTEAKKEESDAGAPVADSGS